MSGALGSAECRGTLFMTSVSHCSCQAPCSSNDTLCDSGTGKFSSKKLIVPVFENKNIFNSKFSIKLKIIYNIIFSFWNCFLKF